MAVEEARSTEIILDELTRLNNDLATMHRELAKKNRELSEERERYHVTLASIADAVIAADSAGRIVFLNPVAESLTGWDRQEAQGKNLAEVFVTEEERINADPATLLIARDGTARPIEHSRAPIEDEQGRCFGTVLVFRDVTERQQQAARLARQYERERRIAETLQRALLLESRSIVFPGLLVEPFYEAAWDEAQVGGDFYDAFAFPDGAVALVVGDVAGKGLSAAARTAEVKYALRAFLQQQRDPAHALALLNDFLCHSTRNEETLRFVALGVIVLDSERRDALIALAGCEPPLALRGDGAAESIEASGLPLGIEPGVEYPKSAVRLSPGDILLMSTDGLTEAKRGRALLGYDGLVQLSQEARGAPSLRAMGEAILAGTKTFAGGPLHDDICFVLARCT